MTAPLELIGQPAAPGFAIGALVCLREPVARHASSPNDAPDGHVLLTAAIDRAVAQLELLQATAGDADAADIIAFQVAMLEDDALRAPAFEAIDAGASAEAAWRAAMAAQLAEYESAADPYFRARGVDLTDLRDRVLRSLGGTATAAIVPRGAILAADDLTPSRFLELDWSAGGGIALSAGSAASHVAMLARARGVPMVVGLGRIDMTGHATAVLDGGGGILVLSPDAATRAAMAGAAARAGGGVADAALLKRPARTADGEPVKVLLNLSDPRELPGPDPAICDGVGVVRTEFLFTGPGLPDEATQYAAYCRILDFAAGRPVTIRTLDAGGDKPVPGLTPEGESNPFLGVRGLRLSLARPEVFVVQLRALARAAACGAVKIMLPMVTVPAELTAARVLLHQAAAALAAEGIAHRIPPLGIMVEVPAAALAIEQFAADFLSIGTNDLTQYVTAAGRDIGAVAALADPANPAVLRLIAEVARHGEQAGIEVSVCGDMAGEPVQVALLLRAGIRVLSVAPNRVGVVKAAIAGYCAGAATSD